MEDSLVNRRSRRSTAGNRMEAALAEFKADELGQDIEEDVDFIMGKDEDDAFESDFASTDEEGAQEDVDAAAEKMVREEEKGVRRAGRTQLEKITAAAHARNKVTFNPQAAEMQQRSAPPKPKRRVSMGVVINAETGEVMESARKRQSRRTHTMMNTSATVNRMKEEVVKKSALPKKAKIKTRAPTQAELIARALDMEEGNMKEHRDYLRIEEEKRARAANLVRETVQGPLLRWVSRIEEIKVVGVAKPPPPPPPSHKPAPTPPAQTTSVSASTASTSVATSSPATLTPSPYQFQYGYSYPGVPMPNVVPGVASAPSGSKPPPTPAYFHPSAQVQAQQQPMPYFAAYSVPTSSNAPNGTHAPQQPPSFVYQPFPPHPTPPAPSAQTPNQYIPPPPSQPSAPPPPEPAEWTEKVMKCYLYHEVPPADKQDPEKPSWGSTMAALFGDHVNWENLKVFTTKGRPTSRPVQTCPITGQPARYLDPRSAVPFANVGAYRAITQILGHEYVWDEVLGCYTGYEGPPSLSSKTESQPSGSSERAKGVPENAGG